MPIGGKKLPFLTTESNSTQKNKHFCILNFSNRSTRSGRKKGSKSDLSAMLIFYLYIRSHCFITTSHYISLHLITSHYISSHLITSQPIPFFGNGKGWDVMRCYEMLWDVMRCGYKTVRSHPLAPFLSPFFYHF